MKEININMKSVEVKTTTRPIRADWTSEMTQDLSTYYGMDNISSIEVALLKEIVKEKRKNKMNQIH